MVKTVELAFDAVYKKIAKVENHVKLLSIASNWGVDVFRTADYKATITDAGYYKTVSRVLDDKVIWCVTETSNNSGSKYSFRGITEDQFVTGVAPLIETTVQ